MNIVLEELTVIGGAVGPEELSMTVFLTVHELSLENGAIWPLLPAKTVLIV